MSDILIESHNFSKIGKYIANKLHHIRKPKKQTQPAPPLSARKHKEKSDSKENRIPKRYDRLEPTVGSYQVNFSAVDKNIPNVSMNRSTPHFFGQKYRSNEITHCLKQYPDGLSQKQKGLTEIGRMTGRDQIKGYSRRNMENPHENRFELKKFPNLTARAATIAFAKMSPRRDCNKNELPLPDYDCNFQVNMKRLDSHIVPFEKQTSRYHNMAKTICFQDFRTNEGEQRILVDKTVSWNKQLPREVQGTLPSYMDKSINSRMAMSLLNLKTLEMNCSDMRQCEKRLPRRRAGQGKAVLYKEKNCLQE